MTARPFEPSFGKLGGMLPSATGGCQRWIGPKTLTDKVFWAIVRRCLWRVPPHPEPAEAFMIRSMTGYGRAEATSARTILTVECRSVNHRHIDVSLKLPRALTAFEADARRLIQAAVQRGRVDVSAAVTTV